jgi:GTP cyclohydrolase I
MLDKNTEEKDLLTCRICGRVGFVNLAGHIWSAHRMTGGEYRIRYGDAILVTKEHAQWMALLSNEKWKETDTRERRVSGIIASYTPQLLAQRKEGTSQQWQNPEIREKMTLAIQQAMTEARCEEISERVIEWWVDKKSPMAQLRSQLEERAQGKCEHCGVSNDQLREMGLRSLCLHHLNYDRLIPTLDDVELLCSVCHGKEHGGTHKDISISTISKCVGELLRALHVSLDDPNFCDTPRRVAQYLIDFIWDENSIESELEQMADAIFPSETSGLIFSQNIETVSICPHHLLPVFCNVRIAYLPTDYCIGVSKLARIAMLLANRPMLQERYTLSVAYTLERLLMPEGVAVIVEAQHSCMTARGVRQHDSFVTTSEMLGLFRTDQSLRAELMSMIRSRKEF